MNEKWKDRARTGVTTYTAVHRRGTEGKRETKRTVCSAEHFSGQRVEYMAGDAMKNAEQRECQQKRRKTGLHVSYYRRALGDNKLVDCAVLEQINSTARKVLKNKTLNWRLNELGKQKQRNREKLASENEKLERTRNKL